MESKDGKFHYWKVYAVKGNDRTLLFGDFITEKLAEKYRKRWQEQHDAIYNKTEDNTKAIVEEIIRDEESAYTLRR